jgi:hypothetical protein
MDRGVPNHHIASHQEFGGLRGEAFFDDLGSASPSRRGGHERPADEIVDLVKAIIWR